MKKTEDYYKEFVTSGGVVTEFNISAEHSMVGRPHQGNDSNEPLPSPNERDYPLFCSGWSLE